MPYTPAALIALADRIDAAIEGASDHAATHTGWRAPEWHRIRRERAEAIAAQLEIRLRETTQTHSARALGVSASATDSEMSAIRALSRALRRMAARAV